MEQSTLLPTLSCPQRATHSHLSSLMYKPKAKLT